MRASLGPIVAIALLAAGGSSDVADLPVVEIAAHGQVGPRFAILVSGDGGWTAIDHRIGGVLSDAGVPVLGLNSLRYLWKRRTPEELGETLTRMLRHATQSWGPRRVVLVGYSYGAELLPFMASRLPDDLRERIDLIVLLGPSPNVDFEFHLSNWLSPGKAGRRGVPVAPEVDKLRGVRIVCIQGRDENDSLCPELVSHGVTRVELEGGHHFGGDYEDVGQRILDELEALPARGSRGRDPARPGGGER